MTLNPQTTPESTVAALDASGTESPNRRPRSLIVSFFGSYGRDIGGWISVADLISVLAELGVDAPATRSAISRLKRRGLLDAERNGRVAGYRLSAEGIRILAEGDLRIFNRQVAHLSEGWVLVIFSFPESERRKRHVLRSQLTWLGFGTTAAGVWIAPAHLSEQARQAVHKMGMDGYVELFHATHLGFSDLAEAVARWWDLPALQEMYETFLEDHEPVLNSWRSHGTITREREGAAFADHLRAVDAWRRMPFLDPGLPPELLPASWAGRRAARVFFDLHTLLHEPSLAHVRAVTGTGPPHHRPAPA